MRTDTNWAGNYTYNAARLYQPETMEQLRAIIVENPVLRVLGSRHSFNEIADTSGDQVSLGAFNKVVALDRERGTATIEGGITYGALGQYLQAEGLALHNMASLPHISVAGACATATHGSGQRNGNLATAVVALELLTAAGERVTLSREHDGDQFAGAVVGLGALGVVTQLTLRVEPTFDVQQDVYQHLPIEELDAHFDEIMGMAYSVSLFTNWRGNTVNQVWFKRRVEAGNAFAAEPELFGATRTPRRLHPIVEISAESCTEQNGIPGPWNDRLPHFRMEFTPSSGDELQTEYFVPRQHALAAFKVLQRMGEQIAPLLMISEVRAIAADDLWMSPCYGQDCVAFHFTWQPNWPRVQALLPTIEAQLAPFAPRPHWGKLFTMAPSDLQARYPRLPEFRELLRLYDPEGKFRNAFVDRYIFH